MNQSRTCSGGVGVATKEQYAEALKGYQDAVEETKSHDRDKAKAYLARKS